MNEEKLSEVADKLEVNQLVIKRAKWKAFLKKLIYPLTQVTVNIASIGLLVLSYPLLSIGMSSSSFTRSTYPANISEDVIFILINPFNWTLHIGNFTSSFLLHKKIGVKRAYIILASILNIFLAGLAFVGLHQLVNQSVVDSFYGTGISIDYGVYHREMISKS